MHLKIQFIVPMLLFFALLTVSCSDKIPKPEVAISSSYSQFGIDSVSKDDLKKYAPKEIDKSTKNKLSLYLDIQSPTGAILHPNKKDLFFNWRITGSQQVWKMSGIQSYPIQLTGGKDLTTVLDIAPNGTFIVLQRDVDGQENPGIYIQNVNGGPLRKIFHEPKIKANFQFISDDSKTIYFTSNKDDAQSFFIYKIDIETKKLNKFGMEKEFGLFKIIKTIDYLFLTKKVPLEMKYMSLI